MHMDSNRYMWNPDYENIYVRFWIRYVSKLFSLKEAIDKDFHWIPALIRTSIDRRCMTIYKGGKIGYVQWDFFWWVMWRRGIWVQWDFLVDLNLQVNVGSWAVGLIFSSAKRDFFKILDKCLQRLKGLRIKRPRTDIPTRLRPRTDIPTRFSECIKDREDIPKRFSGVYKGQGCSSS